MKVSRSESFSQQRFSQRKFLPVKIYTLKISRSENSPLTCIPIDRCHLKRDNNKLSPILSDVTDKFGFLESRRMIITIRNLYLHIRSFHSVQGRSTAIADGNREFVCFVAFVIEPFHVEYFASIVDGEDLMWIPRGNVVNQLGVLP